MSEARKRIACCCAVLMSYIGLVHEVLAGRVFPAVVEDLGGAIPFHVIGLIAIAGGPLLILGVLRWPGVPIRFIAVCYLFAGLFFTTQERVLHGDFQFFAATVALAAVVFLIAIWVPKGI